MKIFELVATGERIEVDLNIANHNYYTLMHWLISGWQVVIIE